MSLVLIQGSRKLHLQLESLSLSKIEGIKGDIFVNTHAITWIKVPITIVTHM